jgi:hypothetical protein
MRTTVDIDDRILERAKQHATSLSQTLGDVVSEALRAYLAARPKKAERPFQLIVRGKPGGRFPSAEDLLAAEEADEIAALGGRRSTGTSWPSTTSATCTTMEAVPTGRRRTERTRRG